MEYAHIHELQRPQYGEPRSGFLRTWRNRATGSHGVYRLVRAQMPNLKRLPGILSGLQARRLGRSSKSDKMPPVPKRKQPARSAKKGVPPSKKRKSPSTKSRGTQTMKARSSATRKAATSSQSGGFLRTAKAKTTTMERIARYGVTSVRENGVQIVAPGTTPADEYPESVIVGHATHEPYMALDDLARALIKMVAQKMFVDLKDFSEVAIPLGASDPQINFDYYAANAAFNTVLACTPGTTTWDTLKTNLRNSILVNDTNNTNVGYSRFISFSFRRSATSMTEKYDLQSAKVSYAVKTSLKIQNRTLSASGSTSDDIVDQQPIYGKAYYTEKRNHLVQAIKGGSIADSDVIGPIGGYDVAPAVAQAIKWNSTNTLKEPPMKTQLIGVKQVGNAHLEPGQIKTSVLTESGTVGLNWYWNKLNARKTSTLPQNSYFGKARYFVLEKMLTMAKPDVATAIRVAFECDHKHAIAVNCKRMRPSASYISLKYSTVQAGV